MLFYEYFHGDTGRGVGASHQTGWTALVVRALEDLAVATQKERSPSAADTAHASTAQKAAKQLVHVAPKSEIVDFHDSIGLTDPVDDPVPARA